MKKICIVGAGPVGCYLAYLLAQKGYNIEIFEEHKVIGMPFQCTGLLTSSLEKIIPVKKEFLVNRINDVCVKAGNQKISFSWTEVIKYLIAIAALVGFSWFIIYLIGKTTNASELEWTRAVYLLSGVEAVAFAAAGFIFGREVNRQRAEKAEQRASKSELENIESLKR